MSNPQIKRKISLLPDYANTVVTGAKKSGMRYRAAAREETGETVMWYGRPMEAE